MRSKFPLADIMVIDNSTVYSIDGAVPVAGVVPAALLTKEEREDAAVGANLDLGLVRGDDELTRFLEVGPLLSSGCMFFFPFFFFKFL